MSSERFEQLLSALLDGSIADSEREELCAELGRDPTRAKAVIELMRLEPLLQDTLAQDRDSGGFPRRVQDALTSADGESTRRMTVAVLEKLQAQPLRAPAPLRAARSRWSRWTIAMASAAALFAITIGIGHFYKGSPLATLDASQARVVVLDGARETHAIGQIPVYRRQGLRCDSGSAKLVFADGSSVTLPPGSEVESVSDSYSGTSGPVVSLKTGTLHADVQPQPQGSAFRVVTNSAVIKVIGTRFTVSDGQEATRLDVHEGKVEMKRSADGEKVDVTAGYFAIAATGIDLTPAPLGKPSLTAISYLGDEGEDSIVAAEIQNDGTVVLAANMDGNWDGRASVELPGATGGSKGILVRLSSDGRTVLSVARVADAISDMSMDSAGAIYLAAEEGGLLKISASGMQLEWRVATDHPCMRVDAGRDGTVAALLKRGKEPARVGIYSRAGEAVGALSAPFTANDVAIDSVHRLVYVGGSRPGNTARGEIGSVAYLNAYNWDGSDAWCNYGFDPAMETNLRSHTLCERIALGCDGKLYGAFLSIGGSTIFSRDPKTFATETQLGGNDPFSRAYSTGNTYITFVARFDPLNGDLLAGQLLLGRDENGRGTGISPVGGGIAADHDGRVYVVGKAGFGGPVTNAAWGSKEFSGQEGFLCVFEPDLKRRASYSTFNSGNDGGSLLQSVAVPRRKELQGAYALGGAVSTRASGIRTLNAIQNSRSRDTEGFFVISGFNGFKNAESVD